MKALDYEGGLQYEYEPGHGFITDREWWPQAEAVVGFLNAYQLTRNEKFLDNALKMLCHIIKNYLIDRINGEWFFRVDEKRQTHMEGRQGRFLEMPVPQQQDGV